MCLDCDWLIVLRGLDKSSHSFVFAQVVTQSAPAFVSVKYWNLCHKLFPAAWKHSSSLALSCHRAPVFAKQPSTQEWSAQTVAWWTSCHWTRERITLESWKMASSPRGTLQFSCRTQSQIQMDYVPSQAAVGYHSNVIHSMSYRTFFRLGSEKSA